LWEPALQHRFATGFRLERVEYGQTTVRGETWCSGPEYLTGKRPRDMEPEEAKKETHSGLFFVGGVVRRATIEGQTAPA